MSLSLNYLGKIKKKYGSSRGSSLSLANTCRENESEKVYFHHNLVIFLH